MRMYSYIILEKRLVMVMLRYEIKKIFSKPVNKIAVLILIAVTLTAGFLTLRDVRYMKEDGSVVSGIFAKKYLKEEKNKWKGNVTEEVLKKVVETNNSINMKTDQTSEEGKDAAFQKKQGFEELREMLSLAFSEMKSFDYYAGDHVSAEEAGEVYERRISGLKDYLNSDERKGAFRDKEEKFLIDQYKKMETPLYYEYADGWKALMDSQYLPTLTIMIVVIIGFLIAGVFSDEFSLKADAVFFSAKLGRNKAVLAKIGAGFITITAVYWGVMLLYSAFVLCALGFDGAGCAIQTGLSNWNSIYNLTYLQKFFFCMFGGYFGCLFILVLAMLVSAKCHSTVIAVTIPFVLSCAPMFLGRIPMLTRILTLFPDQLLRMSESLEEFILYEIGGKIVGFLTILVPLYCILSIIIIPALYGVYKRTEIK